MFWKRGKEKEFSDDFFLFFKFFGKEKEFSYLKIILINYICFCTIQPIHFHYSKHFFGSLIFKKWTEIRKIMIAKGNLKK